MAYVPTAPRTRTYEGDRRELRADVGRLDRKRPPRVAPVTLVRVSPHEVKTWPPCTVWLDTTTVGPLGSHPLKVKLEDGTWDLVAYLRPA